MNMENKSTISSTRPAAPPADSAKTEGAVAFALGSMARDMLLASLSTPDDPEGGSSARVPRWRS